MARLLRFVPAVWVFLLLAGPGALWLAGTRQKHVEGKGFAPIPTLTGGSLRDAATYDEIDLAVLDRLPMREHALNLRAHLMMDLFRTSPVTDAKVGDDGWLFLSSEVLSCDGSQVYTDPVAAIDVTMAALKTSGRRGTIALTGSKFLAEQEVAPRVDKAKLECQRSLESRLAAQAASYPEGLNLAPGLAAIKAEKGHTFLKRDTHWTDESRMLYIRSVLNFARRGLADEAGLAFGGYIQRPADLAKTMEVARTDADRTINATQATRPLKPGSVVIVGDSQTGFSLLNPIGSTPMFAGPLVGQAHCEVFSIAAGLCDAIFRASDTIIWQTSLRYAPEFGQRCGRAITTFTEKLSGKRTSLQVNGADVDTLPLRDPVAATIVAPRDERTDVPRLVRVPVRKASPTAAAVSVTATGPDGKPLPCSESTQTVPTDPISVPVPAGMSVGEIALNVPGGQSTEFGRPEVIDLDGRAPRQRTSTR